MCDVGTSDAITKEVEVLLKAFREAGAPMAGPCEQGKPTETVVRSLLHFSDMGYTEKVRSLLHFSDMRPPMSAPASSIPAAIRDRTSASAQPHVWTPEDFADLGPRTAVDQALHRLVASKSLRRIARGFYDIPQDNRLTGKPTYPNP